MKRLLAGLLGLVAIAAVFASTAHAADSDTNIKTVAADQTINHDYYVAGEDTIIAGTINGDVYSAGGSLEISGTVNGNVYVAQSALVAAGHITGSLHAVASTIRLEGTIGHNVYALANTLDLTTSSNVSGNLYATAATLSQAGKLGGFLKAVSNDATIGGHIGQYVDVFGSALKLGSGADIAGNVHYWSANDLTADPGAKIGGDTTRHDPPRWEAGSGEYLNQGRVLASFIWLIGTILASIVCLRLFPGLFKRAADTLPTGLSRELWTGFAFVILVPIAAFFAAVTIIGLPLGLLLMGLYLFGLFVGPLVSALWLGQRLAALLGQHVGPTLAAIGGLLTLWIVSFVPFIGALIAFIALCAGIGSLITLWRGKPAKPVATISPTPAANDQN